MAASAEGQTPTTRLLTPRFALIGLAALCYFMSFTMLLPTLPRWLSDDVGASELQIGIIFGAFGLSAALLRPRAGRAGDKYGRRILLVAGALMTAATILLYPVWPVFPVLLVLRLLGGLGETGAFVAAATATQDLAPDDRRGEAASYFSVALYAALGLGPLLGELVFQQWDFIAVTRVSALLALIAAGLGFSIPGRPPESAEAAEPVRGFLHPAATRPGALLALSLIGFTGYSAFLAGYLDKLNLTTGGSANAGTVFFLYAVVVAGFRVVFARLPDRLGARRGSNIAFGFIGVGFAIITAWPTLMGVYVGTVVLAVGMAFNYPALFLFVMAETPDAERSHSVASFGFFFDVASIIGAPLAGAVLHFTGSDRAAFSAGAIAAAVGIIGLRFLPDPKPGPDRGVTPPAAEAR